MMVDAWVALMVVRKVFLLAVMMADGMDVQMVAVTVFA